MFVNLYFLIFLSDDFTKSFPATLPICRTVAPCFSFLSPPPCFPKNSFPLVFVSFIGLFCRPVPFVEFSLLPFASLRFLCFVFAAPFSVSDSFIFFPSLVPFPFIVLPFQLCVFASSVVLSVLFLLFSSFPSQFFSVLLPLFYLPVKIRFPYSISLNISQLHAFFFVWNITS